MCSRKFISLSPDWLLQKTGRLCTSIWDCQAHYSGPSSPPWKYHKACNVQGYMQDLLWLLQQQAYSEILCLEQLQKIPKYKFLLIKQSWNPIMIEICGPNLKRYRKRHQELVLIFCRMEHLIHDQMNIGGWSAFSPDPWSTSHHSHGSGFKASQPPLCISS